MRMQWHTFEFIIVILFNDISKKNKNKIERELTKFRSCGFLLLYPSHCTIFSETKLNNVSQKRKKKFHLLFSIILYGFGLNLIYGEKK